MHNKPKRTGFIFNLFKSKGKVEQDSLPNVSKVKNDTINNALFQVEREPLAQRDVDKLWFLFQQRIDTKEKMAMQSALRSTKHHYRPSLFARPAFGFVFALVLLVGGTYVLYKKLVDVSPSQNEQVAQFQTLNVKNGQRAKLVLSDGSIIVADAGSEIRYPTEFTTTRDIYLKGEAYFQVAHDSERPFIVHANQAVVQVYGTKFNVRAWDENPVVTVAVEEGKVSLADADDKNTAVFLTKNQMSRLEQQGPPTHAETTEFKDHLSWMNYEIKFENATIKEVLAQLQRWYDYHFEVQDSSIMNDRLTVQIVKTNVDDVLQVISLLTNSNIEKDSTTIKILPNH